jgi:hypothetical protein
MRTAHTNIRQPDSAGRIIIGKAFRGKLFSVQPQPNGDILLSPVVVRHEREAWLFENAEALASVRRGLEQSARGETHDLGDFSQYAHEGDETE